jgi:NADH-quinone oxidoreductase subunit M
MTALFFSVVGMIYDRAHTRNMDELSGMRRALPWLVIPFIIGGLVSMGMPGLSGFIAEFPIFMGVWNGTSLNLDAVFSLNPSSYYNWIALIAVLGIIITAAYILRAVNNVFFGEFDDEKWHDMRPLLAIDKFALIMFCALMILIGVVPNVIAPIVESGMLPVVERIQSAQQVLTVMDSLHVAATNIFQLFGGA